jgi:hypothetical protein
MKISGRLTIFLFMLIFISGLLSLNSNWKTNHEDGQVEENLGVPQVDLGTREVYHYGPITNTYFSDICLAGDYAFLAARNNAPSIKDLMIVDISDPTNPEPAYYLENSTDAYGVAVAGDYAYLANTVYGLTAINIMDLTTLSPFPSAGSVAAYGVDIAGDYAYLALRSNGLGVVDISDPMNMPASTDVGSYSSVYGVFVAGDYCYTADFTSGLTIFDISNPTNPVLVSNRDTNGYAYGVYVSGDYCYLALGSTRELAIIDISDPLNPGTPIYRSLGSASDPRDVVVVGDLCYVADGTHGIAIINVTNPLIPGEAVYQSAYGDGDVRGICVEGEYAYLAVYNSAGHGALDTVKIGELIDPEFISNEMTADDPSGVFVSGDYLYIADKLAGLSIMEISDPTNPVWKANRSVGSPQWGMEISVDGDYAFLAVQPYGLIIINVSDPLNPGTPIFVSTTAYPQDVHVAGNFAYVADGAGGLAIINITDPTNPGAPDYWTPILDVIYGVYIEGDYAFTARGGYGMDIVNISDPTNPILIKTVDSVDINLAHDVVVAGDYAYVVDRRGLAVINITDPVNAAQIAYIILDGASNRIDISGDRAYISCIAGGVAVIDISDPANPSGPVYWDPAGNVDDVFVAGEYVYATVDSSMGIAVLQIMEPWYALSTPVLEPITPNPDRDGIVNLTWAEVEGATDYYIYRGTESFTQMTGLTPIGNTTSNYYTDFLPVNGSYYYAVVARNSRGRSWISNSEDVNISITYLSQGSYGSKQHEADDTFVLTPQPMAANNWYGFYLDCNGSYNYDLTIQHNGIDFHSSTQGPGEDDWVLWYPGSSYNSSAVITYASGENTTYHYTFMNTTTRSLGPGYFTRWFSGSGELLQFNVPSNGYHYIKLYNSTGIRARVYGPAFPNSIRDASYVAQMEVIGVNDSMFIDDTWLGASGMYTILINRLDNDTSYRNYTLEFCNDPWAPGSFTLVSPSGAVGDQTPTVVCDFWETGVGVDISTVEYAYSTDGDSAPTNWADVDGVFRDAACTIPAQDYDSGTLYARVNGVPFNQASDTNNTIRFQARDMVAILGTQLFAFTIIVDQVLSVSQNDYGGNNLTYGNDTFLLNPQPLPTGWGYGFYLDCNGSYDYDLMIRHQSIDWRESTQGTGLDDWVVWYPGSTYIYTAEVRYVSGSNTTYQYQFLNTTYITPSGWYHRSFAGKGELLQVNLATAGTYGFMLNNSPGIHARIFGPTSSGMAWYASGIPPNAELYTADASLNYTTLSASGTYLILITREDNNFNGTYSMYIQKDDLAPSSFALNEPVSWTTDQTPMVICEFNETGSGIDISSVWYAFATDGSSSSTWLPVDGVYIDSNCTILAYDGYSGLLYAKVDAVAFNQDSDVNNTIRFRAGDLVGGLGVQPTPFTIKVDTIYSVNLNDYGINTLTILNDSYTLNPQPLPTGQWYGFFMDYINFYGPYDYDVVIMRDGIDNSGSYQGEGADEWVIWWPGPAYDYSAQVRYFNGSKTYYRYHFLNTTSISPTAGWQVRSFHGTGELLQVTLNAGTNYSLRLTNSADIRLRVFGPAPASYSGSGGVPHADLYAPDSAGYATMFSVSTTGTYVILVNLENDNVNATYSLYLNDESNPPTNFLIESPSGEVIDPTPTVVGRFTEGLGSGINVSAVEYAYSTDGSLTPENWQPVDGVYLNAECTVPATDYGYGIFYAIVNAVPFNQYSLVNNTIRFRARDMVGNLGTQNTAVTIQVREILPLNLGDYGNKTLTDLNDTFILNPQPLPVGSWYGFYMSCLGSYDYDVLIRMDGNLYSGSNETFGENDWVLWYPGALHNYSADVIYWSGENTTYQYQFLNTTAISLTLSWLSRTLVGKGELLQISVATPGQYVLKLTNAAGLHARLYGPANPDSTYNASDIPLTEILNLPTYSGLNSTILTVSTPGEYLLLINRENNLTSPDPYSLYFNQDATPPSAYELIYPTDWNNNQTPMVVCRFLEGISGINVSSVEFAYATDGNLTPTNWIPVDGVFRNQACTNPAIDGDDGYFYAKVDAVPFNQDSETENTIRFRARDLAGLLGNQSSAFIIKIDTREPRFFMIDEPTDWVANQTPRVGFAFNEIIDGLNVSTVEYAYSTDGNQSWSSWISVDGVFNDSGYSIPASDGENGWVWGEVLAVPFGQDHDADNKIRFRATDLAGNIGTSSEFIIKVDTTAPTITVNSVDGQYYATPPLMDVDFNDLYTLDDAYYKVDSYLPSGTNTTGWIPIVTNSTVEYHGNDFSMNPSVWGNLTEGNHTMYFKTWDDVGNINDGPLPSWQFYKDTTPPETLVSLTLTEWVNDQTPTVFGIFLVNGSGVNVSSVEYAYSTTGNLTPTNWAPVDTVFNDSMYYTLAQDGDVGWMYVMIIAVPFNQDSATLNTIRIRAADMVGNMGTQSTAFTVKIDTRPPENFTLESPSNWVNNVTPSVIGRVYTVESGINTTTFEFAFSTDGNLTPENWTPVGGVYEDINCTDLAENGDTGWLYVKVNMVEFYQDSETNNTIRFRGRDMAGNLGTQDKANIIQIDTQTPNWTLITHEPTEPSPGDTLTLCMTMNASSILSGVLAIEVHFDIGTGWEIENMTENSGDFCTSILTTSNTTEIYLYFIITDNAGNREFVYSESEPLKIDLKTGGGFNWLIIIILVAAIAAMAVVLMVVRSRRASVTPTAPVRKEGVVKPLKGAITDKDLDSRLEYLLQNRVSIEDIPALKNADLEQIIKEPLQAISKLDAEILASETFIDLSDQEKQEILRDLQGLSESEKEELLAKFRSLNEEAE